MAKASSKAPTSIAWERARPIGVREAESETEEERSDELDSHGEVRRRLRRVEEAFDDAEAAARRGEGRGASAKRVARTSTKGSDLAALSLGRLDCEKRRERPSELYALFAFWTCFLSIIIVSNKNSHITNYIIMLHNTQL